MSNNKKLGKLYSISILAILVASIAVLALGHIAPVYASTGAPKLAAVNNAASPTTISVATTSVNVTAGTSSVTAVDSSATTGYFAIVFSAGATNYVTFSGSQFLLYFSTNGFSQIGSGDIEYAGPFNVAQLQGTYQAYTVPVNSSYFTTSTATFYVGTISISGTSYSLIVGPIPLKISSAYEYIKIFDGSTTSVAVSIQTVNVKPNFVASPASGVAGQTLTFVGGGFPANMVVNVNATYTYTNWAGSSVTVSNLVVVSGINTGAGYFTATGVAPDTGAAVNPNSATSATQPYVSITFKVVNASNTAQIIATSSTPYTEFTRVLKQIEDVTSSTTASGTLTGSTFYGNATASLNVHVFDVVQLAGGNFTPSALVQIVVGTSTFNTTTNATGFFNTTFTVPVLPLGSNVVKVINNGVIYTFTLNVLPTLVLSPNQGPVGTNVNIVAYGFSASVTVYLYWQGGPYPGNTYYWIMNATTGANGQFNVTVMFTVPPHSYGGVHKVVALNTYLHATNSTPITSAIIVGSGTFTVTASFSLQFSLSDAQQAYPTISNNGQIINLIGQGLNPTVTYIPSVDNHFLAPGAFNVQGNLTGDLIMQFVAAGFRPGLHVIAFYQSPATGKYLVVGTVLFWVSPSGDFVLSALSQINATLTSINSTVAQINTSVGSISMSLSSVITMLHQINATIVSLNGNVASLSTAIGNLQASLSALNTTIVQLNNNTVAIKTALGTIQGTITSVSNGVATIQTSLGTITTTLSSIQSSASSASSNASSASSNAATAANYSLYTLILVIITLIISIVAVVFSARRPR